MKKEIKNNDNSTKLAYVSALVKVIELSSQGVLCDSFTEMDNLIDDIE